MQYIPIQGQLYAIHTLTGTIICNTYPYLTGTSEPLENGPRIPFLKYTPPPLPFISYFIYLYIYLVPPRFLSHPDTNILVGNGDVVVLDCSSFGIPKAQTSWMYSNELIQVYGEQHVIEYMTSTNVGTYTCLLQSNAGRLNRTFVLAIKGIIYLLICI